MSAGDTEGRGAEPARGGEADPIQTALDRLRVCYLHGRPGPHPLHGRFARAVGGEFRPVDTPMRWQDRKRSALYRAVASFVNPLAIPDRSVYDVFLVDNLHFAPVFMKGLLLWRSRQRVVVHLGSHTLYFLHTGRFSPRVHRLHLWALRRYDALICEGRMAEEMARDLLGDDCPPTYVTFLGPTEERRPVLAAVEPDLASRHIVTIANGPTPFRKWYKGLDLMVDAFARAAGDDPSLTFEILGEWRDDIVEECLAAVPEPVRDRISFAGRVSDLDVHLARASLYLHSSRGDAFPTSTLEAMWAGLVPMVSRWTGTREVVERVSPELVTSLEPESIAERIRWYFGLSPERKRALSDAAREAAGPYTEEGAVDHYRRTFLRVAADLGIAVGPE